MYINAKCPYCNRNIKKLSVDVLKPGIITCPDCKKMSFVTGLGLGVLAYTISAVIMVNILINFALGHGIEIKLCIAILIMIIAIFVMSLFLDLKK